MHPYVAEQFTDEEAAILRRYVTNLDQPVFALVNLPEVVKGALFARYSRSPKSLRRLFLDEFVGDLDLTGDVTFDATVGLKRAEELYERVFFEYGDDSVAQLGGVHLACEQSSQPAHQGARVGPAHELPRAVDALPRLRPAAAHRATTATTARPRVLDSPLGARYVGDLDRMFDTYGELLADGPVVAARPVPEGRPATRTSCTARPSGPRRSTRSAACCPPPASPTSGSTAPARATSSCCCGCARTPSREAREYAEMMLAELRKVIPSFLRRVDVADRGGAWSEYLDDTREGTGRAVERLFPDGRSTHEPEPPEVRLFDFDPDGEDKVLAAACFSHVDRLGGRRARPRARAQRLGAHRAARGLRGGPPQPPPPSGARLRAHRLPLRARHRLRRVPRPAAPPALHDRVAGARLRARRRRPRRRSPRRAARGAFAESSHARRTSTTRSSAHAPDDAGYAVALAYRIRYVLQLNAREAMHVLELRSGPQGHPAYRRVAQEMHRQIADVAGHRAIAAAMRHVDYEDDRPRAARRRAPRRGTSRSSVPRRLISRPSSALTHRCDVAIIPARLGAPPARAGDRPDAVEGGGEARGTE